MRVLTILRDAAVILIAAYVFTIAVSACAS
jgi:hypothetical protein